MTNLTKYEKGCSPSAIQRKYSLTYEQGYELAERLKKTQELEKENAKLKELLKDCVPYVNHRCIETRETLTKPYTASDKVLHKKAEKLLQKIDEVLK